MADRRLQVFYTVARQLSFTRAAEQLCMTQPAVTFQIKQLEEHFDSRLFERDPGGIALTPTGEIVLEYAQRILELNDELDKRVGELHGAVGGPLLLGCSMTIAEFILPRVLGEFKALHPQVQVHMTVANSETIENRVADHTIDLGLIESPAHLPGLQTEVCCDDELVVICAPDYPLAKQKTVTPRQIIGEPYVSRETGSGTRQPGGDQGRGRNRYRDCHHVARLGGQGVETRQSRCATAEAAPDPQAVTGVPAEKIPFTAACHFCRVRHLAHARHGGQIVNAGARILFRSLDGLRCVR